MDKTRYKLPKPLKAKIEEILGYSYNDFEKALFERQNRSIRLNTIKGNFEDINSLKEKGFILKQMPWYKYGFFVEESKEQSIGNSYEHFLGKIYVQDASSMLPVIVLDAKESDSVLDIAASPGSKTSQIAMHMNNKGAIIANEPIQKRIKALQDNIDRLGVLNTAITKHDGRFFKKMPESFDKVLVDAPCSSEGTIYKDKKVLFKWSEKLVRSLAKLQYQLLESAIMSAKNNAVIVYSTCTISPEENEAVIQKALDSFDIELEKIEIKGLKTSKALQSYKEISFDKKISERCIRIWPHIAKIPAFFIAKIRKK